MAAVLDCLGGRMTNVRIAALAAVLIVNSAACVDDVESDARELVDEICDLTFRCCSRGEVDLFFGPFVDRDSCAERLQNSANLAAYTVVALPFENAAVSVPNLAVLQRAVDEGRADIDEDALAECLDLLGQLECNGPLADAPAEEPDGCEPPPEPVDSPCNLEALVIGLVGDGGDCSSPGVSLECTEGLACRAVDSLGVDGVCVAPGGVDDYCFSDGECDEELYCSVLDGTCQEPKGEGEVCAYGDPEDPSPSPDTLLIECAEGLSCDPITDLCVAPCQLGAQCAGDDDCDAEAGLSCIVGRCDRPRPAGLPCSDAADCAEGLRCAVDESNPGRNVCQERLADGETCQPYAHVDCASGYCDLLTSRCAPASEPGGVCPSAESAQCDGGYCETGFVYCDDDTDCTGSGSCNLSLGRCEYYCIALQPDGSTCTGDGQCASNACVDGFCRTVPLASGQPCTFDSQCASGFCSLDAERVCADLPLPNGSTCSSPLQCDSGVCHQNQCQAGLAEGADCSSTLDPPCGKGLYCHYSEIAGQAPLCAPLRGPGEPCDGSFQCHGGCTIRYGRRMCDATVAQDEAVCDGAGEEL